MMRRFHQLFGLLVVIAFLLTGQYMNVYHNHLQGMQDGPRMLFRTRHIYILLAGLLNLGIGSYFSWRSQEWRRILQMLGSASIVVAPLLFMAAFFYEPGLANLYTPLSHWGMYTIGAGTLFHLLSGVRQNEGKRIKTR
jgi:hypothetical protein